MVGEAGEALVVRISDRAGARGQSFRQERVVDAEPVSPGAEPGIFANLRIPSKLTGPTRYTASSVF